MKVNQGDLLQLSYSDLKSNHCKLWTAVVTQVAPSKVDRPKRLGYKKLLENCHSNIHDGIRHTSEKVAQATLRRNNNNWSGCKEIEVLRCEG